MRATAKPQGQAMYVAPASDRTWLLNEQRRLHERSREHPEYVFCKLWGLVTDPRNLRVALTRVAANRGRRTAGVDGVTVRKMLVTDGADAFLDRVRMMLRSGVYAPSPARRVLIPKGTEPGKFRPLGIPTVMDRVVQAAMKNILEPIFEADFYPVSYGFRPGKSAHAALEHLRLFLRPTGPKSQRRLPCQWAIEGDIKGCFDNIGHHGLMVRVRRRIGDGKVSRLVLAFLKAGVLAESGFLRSDTGTPQGGILSPLLANIALSAIEERYERHVWPRRTPTPLTDPAAIAQRAMGARLYAPLDPVELVDTLRGALVRHGLLHEVRVRGVATGVVDNVRLVLPSEARTLKRGDVSHVGLDISTSCFGKSAVHVAPVIWRLVCSNGMRVRERGQGLSFRHVGDTDRLRAAVAEAIPSALVHARGVMDRWQRAVTFMVEDVARQIESLRELTIPERRALEGELTKEVGTLAVPERAPLYDVVNALTASAKRAAPARRLELETLAGDLVERELAGRP